MWFQLAINILTVVIGLTTIAYFYISRQFSFWARKGVQFKKPHFIYGNFGDIIQKKALVGPALMDMYNSFKGERFGGVWEIFTPKLFVRDPELVGEIMVRDFHTWPHRGIAINSDLNPLDEHLIHLDDKKWKPVRTKLTPTFSSAKLKSMHSLLLESATDLEKYLDLVAKKGEPIDATDIAAKFTTDVIGSCVFGIEMNSLNNTDAVFRQMGRKIFEPTRRKHIVSVLQNGFPWLFNFFKLSTMTQELTDFFINITKETFDYREKNNIHRPDFMDLLKNLRVSEGSSGKGEVDFTDTFLAAQAFVFFAAGFHTSSSTMSCCLHELAVNQEIQNRLREEVHRTKAASKGEISWDDLKNMKYLNMVVQETMRKYPIVPRIHRVSVQPYRIPGTSIDLPVGSVALIPVYALHHDPKYYPDPEKFDPERFTEEAKSKRPAFTYLPFGDGPRICIGLRFAEQQIKMGLAKIVDTCRVSLCEKSQNPLRMDSIGLMLQPEIGVWLTISHIASNEKASR